MNVAQLLDMAAVKLRSEDLDGVSVALDLGVLLTRDRHVYTSETRGKSWTFRGQISADQLPSDIELTGAGEVLVVGDKGLIAESSGGIGSLAEISSGFAKDLHHVRFGNALEGLACGQGSGAR